MPKMAIQLSNISNNRSKNCWIPPNRYLNDVDLFAAGVHAWPLGETEPSVSEHMFYRVWGRQRWGWHCQLMSWWIILFPIMQSCLQCTKKQMVLMFHKHLGKLSHWVQKAMRDGGGHYVLVDRANCRRKVNNLHSPLLRSYIFATCSVVPRSQPKLSDFLSTFLQKLEMRLKQW